MATCRDCGSTLVKEYETGALVPEYDATMPCVSTDGAHTEVRGLTIVPLPDVTDRWCLLCCGAHRHRARWRIGSLAAIVTCDRHLYLACREMTQGTVLAM